MSKRQSDLFAWALRKWLDDDSDGRRHDALAEHVLVRALSPHFGFFKLVIEMRDGPIDPESVPGRIFPSEHFLEIEAQQGLETASAA
jgi:hypothetical protein